MTLSYSGGVLLILFFVSLTFDTHFLKLFFFFFFFFLAFRALSCSFRSIDSSSVSKALFLALRALSYCFRSIDLCSVSKALFLALSCFPYHTPQFLKLFLCFLTLSLVCLQVVSNGDSEALLDLVGSLFLF